MNKRELETMIKGFIEEATGGEYKELHQSKFRKGDTILDDGDNNFTIDKILRYGRSKTEWISTEGEVIELHPFGDKTFRLVSFG